MLLLRRELLRLWQEAAFGGFAELGRDVLDQLVKQGVPREQRFAAVRPRVAEVVNDRPLCWARIVVGVAWALPLREKLMG